MPILTYYEIAYLESKEGGALKHLDIEYRCSTLDPKRRLQELQELVNLLNNKPNLVSLNAKHNNLNDEEAKCLLKLKHIKKLCLSYNDITSAAILLFQNKNFTSLMLDRNCIDEDDIEKIKHLDLSHLTDYNLDNNAPPKMKSSIAFGTNVEIEKEEAITIEKKSLLSSGTRQTQACPLSDVALFQGAGTPQSHELAPLTLPVASFVATSTAATSTASAAIEKIDDEEPKDRPAARSQAHK